MCYEPSAKPPIPSGAAGATNAQDLVLTAGDGNQFAAFSATPAGRTSASVVIFPDVRGLHQFYKELALRFAEQGIAALAFDYFGRTAGLTARDDAFDYAPHTQLLGFETVQTDVAAVLAHAASIKTGAYGTVTAGFCMGGTLSLLTATQQLPLSGAIGFYAGMSRTFGEYGTLLDHAAEIRYPVLGLFGGADPSIPPEQVDSLRRSLAGTGVKNDIVVYPGTPHSFFDRKYAEYAGECDDAWKRVLAFIAAHASVAS